MNSNMIGAGEAARRLGVSPATIQRWVDAGLLSAVRTHGGHRRIPLSEIRRMLAAMRPAPLIGPLATWIEALLEADAARIGALMLAARRRSGSWSVVVEEIASAIAEIGRLWEMGACHIFEEHAASEALRRAAARCTTEMPCGPDAPRAALLTVAGDRHTLGLSLAELIVAEAAWKPLWLGDGPPAEELPVFIERQKPNLIVVAASAVTSIKAISAYQSALEQAAVRGKVGLIFAGGGAWMPSDIGVRVCSFHELGTTLAQRRVGPLP
jgi:excisionase family DNA binding protein